MKLSNPPWTCNWLSFVGNNNRNKFNINFEYLSQNKCFSNEGDENMMNKVDESNQPGHVLLQ